MRKRLIIGATCLALLTPGLAGAATRDYSGPIKSGGEVAFELVKKKKGKFVAKFEWRGLPVDCKRGPNTSAGNLTFRVPVKKKRFSTTAIVGKPEKPDARARITGSFTARQAKGSISVKGSKVPVAQGNPDNCSSGKARWSANR